MCFRRSRKPRVTEAKIALTEAKAHLHKVEEREPEVKQVAEESKKLRRNNHFAQDLQSIFEGGTR